MGFWVDKIENVRQQIIEEILKVEVFDLKGFKRSSLKFRRTSGMRNFLNNISDNNNF